MMYNPPHPGEVFNELYLNPSGMTVEQMASSLVTAPTVLRLLINGDIEMTKNMAVKIGKHFGCSPKPWRKMQADYDWWQLR